MDIKIILLLVLLFIIILGFWRKINIGILAISAAAIIAYSTGAFKAKDVVTGFNASLFVTLLGITFFFGVVAHNGCLDLLLRKITNRFEKQVWFIPILLFAIGFIIAAIGPGCVPALAFVAALAIPLAHQTGYNPIMLMLIGELGTFSGRFTPITPEGIIIANIMGQDGYTDLAFGMVAGSFIAVAILSAIVFVFYKGYNIKVCPRRLEGLETGKFSTKQIIALISILIMLAAVIVLKMDVGLASFIVATFLLLIGIGDSKVVLKSIPWDTLIMVCGVGVLIKFIISSGGIDLIASTLSSVMSPGTAPAIIGASGGVLSWFSSALGVVFPTLMPVVADIAGDVPGASVEAMVTAIGICAACAGISPASTGGAIIMSACQSDETFSKKFNSNRLFAQLFAWSFFCVVVNVGLALAGVFSMVS